jgi:hypothetical protein
MKIIFLILLSLTASKVHAEKVYLFIDAGANPDSNYKTYYNEVRNGYETIKSQGKKAHIFAKDGNWKLSNKRPTRLSKFALTEEGNKTINKAEFGNIVYPPITQPARNLEDIEAGIKNLKLKPQDELVIIINGHGNRKTTRSNPENSTIMLWEREVTWDDFGKMLQKTVPRNKKQLVTNICYGGGVHHLSRALPNTCSSSVVPHYTSSSSGINYEGFFSEHLWKNVRESRDKNFASIVTKAFNEDLGNAGLGSISSFDYIDFIMKKGAYEKVNNGEAPVEYLNYEDIYKKYGESVKAYKREKLNTSSMNINSHASIDECIHCVVDKRNRIKKEITDLTEFSKSIEGSIVLDKLIFLKEGIDSLNKNIDKYLKVFEEISQQEKKLQAEWDNHKKKFDNSNIVYKYLFSESEKRKNIEDRMESLIQIKKSKLKKPLADLAALEMTKRVAEFYKMASPEQKKKFEELISCESLPF